MMLKFVIFVVFIYMSRVSAEDIQSIADRIMKKIGTVLKKKISIIYKDLPIVASAYEKTVIRGNGHSKFVLMYNFK